MFKLIKNIFSGIGILLSGMYGGQKNKAVRRFGIPFIAIFTSFTNWGWRSLCYLPMIGVLSMGYGVNSWLMGICGIEWVVRFVYAILLSLPFYGFSWKRGLIASFSLIIAFAVRAGSAGRVWGMDILIEDICRYGALGTLVVLNNVTRKRNF